ncbi:MAG: ATP-binding cassette domain-containing protein, partial [Caldilineae bacterium]
MTLLNVQGLTKRFGGLVANHNITLTVEEGTVLGLIGPNGAGKTTFFNCITGFYPPTEGRVQFQGQDITGWSPERVCRAGIARTFQIVKVLREMTVLENVMVGAFLHHPRPADARRRALEVLEFTG